MDNKSEMNTEINKMLKDRRRKVTIQLTMDIKEMTDQEENTETQEDREIIEEMEETDIEEIREDSIEEIEGKWEIGGIQGIEARGKIEGIAGTINGIIMMHSIKTKKIKADKDNTNNNKH